MKRFFIGILAFLSVITNMYAQELGTPTALQQLLNEIPAIPIIGKTVKFEFGGDIWITKVNGENFLSGNIILEETDNGYTIKSSITNVWSGAVEQVIDLLQSAGVPLGPAAAPLRTAARLAARLAKWLPLKGSVIVLDYSAGRLSYVRMEKQEDDNQTRESRAPQSTKSASSAKPVPPAPIVPTVTEVTVNSANQYVVRSRKHNFYAVVSGTNAPPQGVTWTVSGSENKNTFIDSNGILTVAADEKSLTLAVQATSVFNTDINGTVDIEVQSITVTEVTVNYENQYVVRSRRHNFSAVVSGANAPPQDVTWSVSGSVNKNTFIDSNGTLTVAADELSSILSVKATSMFATEKNGTININVQSITVTEVTVNSANQYVVRSRRFNFSAIVAGTNDPPQEVTWSVSGSENENTFIEFNGTLTVAADEESLTLTVQAKSVFNTDINGTVDIEVQSITVTEVIVNPGYVSVISGKRLNFTATVIGENEPPQDVTWSVLGSSSIKTNIAPNGILTVASNEPTSNTFTIQATSKFNPQFSGKATVTITPPPKNWLLIEGSIWGGGLRFERSLSNSFTLGLNGFTQTFQDSADMGVLASTRLYPGNSVFFLELGLGYGYIESGIAYKAEEQERKLSYSADGFMINPAIGLRFGRKAKGFITDFFFGVPIVLGNKSWIDYSGGPDGIASYSFRFGIGIGGAW